MYAADLRGWALNYFTHDLRARWPPAPAALATAPQLAAAGLRPRHALHPDGYQVGPCHIEGRPVSFDWSVLDPDDENIARHLRRAANLALDGEDADDFPDDRYPVWSLYRRDQARPHTAPPSPAERHAERLSVSAWAADAAADPATMVLAASTLPAEPALNAEPCQAGGPPKMVELAACAIDGRVLLDTLISPGWKPDRAALAVLGLSAARLHAAPSFADLRGRLAHLLEGRRVMCTDRAWTYGLLYSELEYAIDGVNYPQGTLWPGPHDAATRGVLGRSQWECLRLAYSRFLGQWDDRQHPVLQPGILRPRRAIARARRAARRLHELAGLAHRYAELCAAAEDAECHGRDQHRHTATATRRVRLAVTRDAVLLRAGGHCENPTCPDTGYLLDVTTAGLPLLEVHHCDGDPRTAHAAGGKDHPVAALALCPGCHARVTRGREAASFNRKLAKAAADLHRRCQPGPPHSSTALVPR